MTETSLDRFVDAQNADGIYDKALAELRDGAKTGHWMWFIFPQIAGLGKSETAKFYAIRNRAEAEAFLRHPLLGPRLIACADAVLSVPDGRSAVAIFGEIDAQKLRSSATLFAKVAPADDSVFDRILERFFDAEPDAATLEILGIAR